MVTRAVVDGCVLLEIQLDVHIFTYLFRPQARSVYIPPILQWFLAPPRGGGSLLSLRGLFSTSYLIGTPLVPIR